MVSLLEIKERFEFIFEGPSYRLESAPLQSVSLDYQKIYSDLLDSSCLKSSELKAKTWIEASAASLQAEYNIESILKSWSEKTKEILHRAWSRSFQEKDEICLFPMGKLGSNELNLSSDIDLIFFGEAGYKAQIRDFILEVSGQNDFPQGYDLDFDLRPGGEHAPFVTNANSLGNHLWKSSDPWERYSYTRASSSIGNVSLSEKIKKIVEDYCFRKYLSSDFFPYFLKLRETYASKVEKGVLNLKLGRGGIRDIELFVQTFQIIYGGKDKKFRFLSTFELIRLFIEEGIHEDIFKKIQICYSFLRHVESVKHAFQPNAGFEWVDTKEHCYSKEISFVMSEVRKVFDLYKSSKETHFNTDAGRNLRSELEASILKGAKDRKVESSLPLSNYKTFFSEKNKKLKPYLKALLDQKEMKESFIDLLCYSKFGCEVLSRRPSLLDLYLLRQYDISEHSDKLQSLADIKMLEHILASNAFVKKENIDSHSLALTKSYERIMSAVLGEAEGLDILFLGKMATREIGLSSDLDFVFVYDEDVLSKSEASKKARSVYRDLAFYTVFGPLVPYDKSGGIMGMATPLVVSLHSVEKFLNTKAEPWQKLMHLRNRFLISNKFLNLNCDTEEKDFFKNLQDILEKRLSNNSIQSDLKLVRGGLFHIEFVQGMLDLKFELFQKGDRSTFERFEALVSLNPELKNQYMTLQKNYNQLRVFREKKQICNEVIDFKPCIEENLICLSDILNTHFKEV